MCPLSFWSHQLSSFFPLLPRLELHDSLRPLLVEDPVAALAAANDVPGFELVLVALMRFCSFGGGGARREVEVRQEGEKGERKKGEKGESGGGQRARTFSTAKKRCGVFGFSRAFTNRPTSQVHFSHSRELEIVVSGTRHDRRGRRRRARAPKENQRRRCIRRPTTGDDEKRIADVSSLSGNSSFQLTAVATEVRYAGRILKLRGGAEHAVSCCCCCC